MLATTIAPTPCPRFTPAEATLSPMPNRDGFAPTHVPRVSFPVVPTKLVSALPPFDPFPCLRSQHGRPAMECDIGFAERALVASGAAVVSVVLVNVLDVTKVRL